PRGVGGPLFLPVLVRHRPAIAAAAGISDIGVAADVELRPAAVQSRWPVRPRYAEVLQAELLVEARRFGEEVDRSPGEVAIDDEARPPNVGGAVRRRINISEPSAELAGGAADARSYEFAERGRIVHVILQPAETPAQVQATGGVPIGLGVDFVAREPVRT